MNHQKRFQITKYLWGLLSSFYKMQYFAILKLPDHKIRFSFAFSFLPNFKLFWWMPIHRANHVITKYKCPHEYNYNKTNIIILAKNAMWLKKKFFLTRIEHVYLHFIIDRENNKRWILFRFILDLILILSVHTSSNYY